MAIVCHNACLHVTLCSIGDLHWILYAYLPQWSNTDNIFVHCPITRQVWNLTAAHQCPISRQVWNLTVTHQWLPLFPFSSSLSSLREELDSLPHNQFFHFSSVVLLSWSIWKSHNAFSFKNGAPKPMGTQQRAKHDWA